MLLVRYHSLQDLSACLTWISVDRRASSLTSPETLPWYCLFLWAARKFKSQSSRFDLLTH